MKLKKKQSKFVELLGDRQYDTYVLIGTVGTGKTDVAAHAVISICTKFDNTFWPVIRKNISTVKDTVWPSYLNVLSFMDFVEGEHYIATKNPFSIRFPHSNSEIVFREADHTKDREGKKIKGINATGNHIDEADELQEEMFLMATSRKGRRNENNQRSISIITMNPNNGWAKERFYDPYKKGTLPKNICVVEFDINDSWQSEKDIEMLQQYPEVWKQRYLYNNWDFADDDNSLFKYKFMDRSHINVIKEGTRYAALDVARFGKDRSVAAIFEDKQLIDISIMKDKKDQITNVDLAKKYKLYCETHNVGYEHATVDAVGNGSGVVDYLHEIGFRVKSFIAGSKSEGEYNNLRSETTHALAQGFEKEEVKLLDTVPFLKELKAELAVQNYKVEDRVLKIESKDKVKERLGLSPDIADAVIMAYSFVMDPPKDFNSMFRF